MERRVWFLAGAAHHAAEEFGETYLAGPLLRYRQRLGLSESALAFTLGVSVEGLYELALCRQPKTQADLEEIADRFGADSVVLAEALLVGRDLGDEL